MIQKLEEGASMKLSIKLFIEGDREYVLGPGRVELLRATDSLGSLLKAAQHMGMSYRWAWGRLRDAEKALGVELLTQEGPAARGKAKVLSEEGRQLLRWYGEMEEKIAAVAAKGLTNCPEFLRHLDAEPEVNVKPGQRKRKKSLI